MKTFFRLAINALLYLVTVALVLGGIAVLAAGEVANVRDDSIIAAAGLAAMICVRCRLEGKPLGPPLSLCLSWVLERAWPQRAAARNAVVIALAERRP